MNRRIATWAAAALTVFNLTACSGSPEAAPAPSDTPAVSTSAEPSAPATTTAPETSEPTAPEPSAPTLAEACIEPSLKMAEASTQLAEVSAALASTDGKDPAAMVEAIKGMGEYFGTISESVSDTQLKASLAGMAQGYAGLATGYAKMFIDNDLTASAEVMQAISGLQTSITDFQTLCGVS